MSDKPLRFNYWQPHEFNKVVEMAKSGMTAREIAAEVGRTRNSIIGVLHRSGFEFGNRQKKTTYTPPFKGPPDRKRERLRNALGKFKQVRDGTREPPKIIKAEEPPPEGSVSFMDIGRGQCRAIYGHPKGTETMYCGASVWNETSWCEKHYLRYHKQREAA